MNRSERLARWIEVLEQDPQRRLRSLGEIEFKPRAERPFMRSDNSPLTVAFEDPVLRAEGLASDRLGDAMTFFEMSEREAHYALCSCLNGMSMKAGAAASRVRGIAQRNHLLNAALIVVGAAAALPALAYWLG